MFSESAFKNGSASLPAVARRAARAFRSEMDVIGARIEAKVFDKDGLCQRMPFLWKVLDPRKIPYFLSV